MKMVSESESANKRKEKMEKPSMDDKRKMNGTYAATTMFKTVSRLFTKKFQILLSKQLRLNGQTNQLTRPGPEAIK